MSRVGTGAVVARAEPPGGPAALKTTAGATASADDGPAAGFARPASSAGEVAIDVAGWSDDALGAALDALLADGAPLDARVIVSFAPDQLDAVAAALLGTGVQMLCRPSAAEHAAALAVARAAVRGGVAEPTRGDVSRLLEIGEEIVRIAEQLGGRAETRPALTAAEHDPAAAPVTAAQIRGAIRSRRMRDAVFGAGWFEEPAWDMLLDLFAAELEGTRVSVSSLCIAAAVAQTTALRWITKMIAAGLLERQDDLVDRRRAFVTLSDAAGASMRAYVDAVRRSGLGIA